MSELHDDWIKKSVGDEAVSDAKILECFRKFLPSYTLDYSAPARLGLAAHIAAKRPQLAREVLSRVAEDYFQLGVETLEEFDAVVKIAIREKSHILAAHGSDAALEWLRESAPAHYYVVASRLASLWDEFRREEGEKRSSGRR